MVTREELVATMTMVLAGGQGERLQPLTRHRSKPAVPFGGKYRIIDFTLSNALNSGLTRIWVLTQYKSTSLMRHITRGWDLFSSERGEYIFTLPPQRRIDARWYEGTADAIYHNTNLFEIEKPERVLILSGDHIYRMDYRQMLGEHLDRKAPATLAVCEIPLSESERFGVVEVNEEGIVQRFVEKVADPPTIPGKPDRCLANMGIYLFDTSVLSRVLAEDHRREGSSHDFGRDILPRMAAEEQVATFTFRDPAGSDMPVWRDIGTLDAYYEANMDLLAVEPAFSLYDRDWPVRSTPRQLPPAKTVFADDEEGERRVGQALDSLVSGGCILSGGQVERSILSPNVRVNSYAEVSGSILMDGVDVGRHAVVRNAIVDKGVRIPPGFELGVDLERDRARFTVAANGVVVVAKHTELDTE
jgi:glucose-1-phosphate adenylyltransferase